MGGEPVLEPLADGAAVPNGRVKLPEELYKLGHHRQAVRISGFPVLGFLQQRITTSDGGFPAQLVGLAGAAVGALALLGARAAPQGGQRLAGLLVVTDVNVEDTPFLR